jgi:hypothetical protein
MLLIALLARVRPGRAAIALYAHVSAGGPLLVSWFWSVLNERFDPRTARQRIGWIAGGGAAGGLAGGLLAERWAQAGLSVLALLPALAMLHVAGALLLRPLGRPPATPPTAQGGGRWRFPADRLLRDLAGFVFVITMAAALVDFIFKSQVVSRTNAGETLLRFFALFHAVTGLVTVAVQWTLATRLLASFGIARTAAVLPAAVGFGGFVLLAPGLLGVALATGIRGLEAVLRNSIFRSSYELLFTPIALAERRATKAIIDVGFERLGDAAGAGLIQLVLWRSAATVAAGGADPPTPSLLILAGVAAGLGGLGVWITTRLGPGYVASLKQRLRDRAAPMDAATESDLLTRTAVLDSLALEPTLRDHTTRDAPAPSLGEEAPPPPASPADPLAFALSDLRSGDPGRARAALAGLSSPVPEVLVGPLVDLLGWDAVSKEVVRALRTDVDRLAGRLAAILLDPGQEFVVRRRLPRILAAGSTAAALEGLLEGLGDPRFEVRYRCGIALSHLHRRHPDLTPGPERLLDAVYREAAVDRRVWEGYRLLDGVEPGEDAFLDEGLRRRASRGLAHVFTLLALVHPGEPLRIAFRGLHTDDPQLRGTALEYLDSVLPPRVRDLLRPLIEDPARARGD